MTSRATSVSAVAHKTGDVRGGGQVLAPNDPRHGTWNGYHNLKCRCDRCRDAWRIYINERNWRTGRSVPAEDFNYLRRRSAELQDNHGTETRYKLGCRCEHCRAGTSAARRLRRLTPNVQVHNYAGYASGCRCDVCRDGHNTYQRERRRRLRAERSAEGASTAAKELNRSGGSDGTGKEPRDG